MHGGSPRPAPTATGARWRIPLARPSLPPLDRYTAQLEEIWDAAMLSNGGPQAQRFEAACRDYGGFGETVATASCDLALTLTVRALEIPAGTPVLVPSYTFGSTLHALLWNDLAPRFVDVDPHTFCLDPSAVREALTPDVGLIVATHAFGGAADLPALEALAASVGAPLVLDGAQAFATWSGDEHVGQRGTATAFSFSATKLVTSGEGGLVATADEALAERLRLLRAYGRDGRREASVMVGLNAKMSELHAALGTLSLEQVDADVAARAALVARYRSALDGLPVRFQRPAKDERPSHTFLGLDLGDRRAAIEAQLTSAGIESRRYFRPLHTMALFADVPRHPLPVTDALGAGVLCLPIHAGLTDGEVDEVAAVIRDTIEASA